MTNEIFVSLWWVFILAWAIFSGLAFCLQLGNMRRVQNNEDLNMRGVMVCGLLASITFLLAIISTIMMLINYYKA